MIILALDSTAVVASVALCDDKKLLCSYTVNAGNTHSETLLPMVESALKATNLTVDDIELFALSEGPGSFTGVRIGAATLKGLAFGKDKPCAGVSTLEALAYNLCAFEGILCPCMNARRNQVYNALFRCDGKGNIERLCPDRAIGVEELEEELKGYSEPIRVCGDGAFLLTGEYSFVPEILIHQNGYSVAMCALKAFRQGRFTSDDKIAPTYLRPSQAERTRAEKENGN